MSGYPQPKDPPCTGCDDPCCCSVHMAHMAHMAHHVCESMARWCEERKG